MKKVIILLGLVCIISCGCSSVNALSNEEIVKQTKICQDAGLKTDYSYTTGFFQAYGIEYIWCIPK